MGPWCLYLRTIVCTDERGTFRHLKIAPKDEPDLWRSKSFFLSWLISFDFSMMSSKEALSLKVGHPRMLHYRTVLLAQPGICSRDSSNGIEEYTTSFIVRVERVTGTSCFSFCL